MDIPDFPAPKNEQEFRAQYLQTPIERCSTCDGEGHIVEERGRGRRYERFTCDKCGGTGYVAT